MVAGCVQMLRASATVVTDAKSMLHDHSIDKRVIATGATACAVAACAHVELVCSRRDWLHGVLALLSLSVASVDTAEVALTFWRLHYALYGDMVVVIAQDRPTYNYLSLHQVPTALVEKLQPLEPFCMRRFHTATWRARMAIKVRRRHCDAVVTMMVMVMVMVMTVVIVDVVRQVEVILAGIEVGVAVAMLDPTAYLTKSHSNWQSLDHADLIVRKSSLLFSYSKPTTAMSRLWSHVKSDVLDGGLDVVSVFAVVFVCHRMCAPVPSQVFFAAISRCDDLWVVVCHRGVSWELYWWVVMAGCSMSVHMCVWRHPGVVVVVA